MHAGHQRFPIGQRQALHRHAPVQHAGMIGGREMLMLDIAEIGEGDLGELVLDAIQRQAQLRGGTVRLLFLQVPFAGLAPAEPDRAARGDDVAGGFVVGDGLPFGVVGLAQRLVEIGSTHEAFGHQLVTLAHQFHQHRHIGVLAQIVAEIGHLPIDMVLLQDHVPHRHGQGGVRALFHRQPDIAEFRRFRIVRADHRALHAAIARLGEEMRVRGAGLRNVRAPQDDEAGIVPIGRFRHVGLLAPGLRRGRRQVAVPIIERHADAADQRQIAGTRGVGDHGHRRDRREAEDAVRAVGFRGVGVGGGDDLRHLVPLGAHEAAMAALLHVAGALLRVFHDRGPGGHRGHQRAGFPPQPDQAGANQRVFHPVAGIEIPAVGGAARTAARLVVRQVGPGARVIGLLGFPGDDPALHVDFPRTGAGAVGAMGGADDLVVLPALPVAVLPAPVLVGGDAVAVGEGFAGLAEEGQAIEKMAHDLRLVMLGLWPCCPGACGCHVRCRAAGRRAGCRTTR